jgi:hypothetical protein
VRSFLLLRQAALIALIALSVAACAKVEFVRKDGVNKAPALPGKLEVQLAESLEDVPPPAVVLGTLRLPPSANSLSQIEAEERFAAFAARFGCDTVVDVDATAINVQRVKKTRTLGKGGKVKINSATTTEVHTQWVAQCVRSGKADERAVAAIKKAGGRISRSTAKRLSGSTARRGSTSSNESKAPASSVAGASDATPAPVVKLDVRPMTQQQENEARAKARDEARRTATARAKKRSKAEQAASTSHVNAQEQAKEGERRREIAAKRAAEAKVAAAEEVRYKAAKRAEAKANAAALKKQRAEAAAQRKKAAATAKKAAATAKKAAAEARAAAVEKRKQDKIAAANKRKTDAAAAKVEKLRLAAQEKKDAQAARAKAAEQARLAAEAEKKRIADEAARNAAAIVKAFDDAEASKDPLKIAAAMHTNPSHARFQAAQDAMTTAALARPQRWLVTNAPKAKGGRVTYSWTLKNPTGAPAVVRFEVAGMAHHALVRAGKSVKGKLTEPKAAKTATRLLDVIVVTRELAIDRNAAARSPALETVADVWAKLPSTALTSIYLQRIDEYLAKHGAATTKIRGSVRPGRRPNKDAYQPAKVSLSNGANRDVTVIYDAGTGRFERLLLRRGGKMSLTLMIPPDNKAKMEIKAVLPRLRSLDWLTGRWILGSAQLVFVPAGKGSVAGFVIHTPAAGAGPRRASVMPLVTKTAGTTVGCRGKTPSDFARSVFFDLPPCPTGGCDTVLTVPLQKQDEYDEAGGRSLHVDLQIGERNGKTRFTSTH